MSNHIIMLDLLLYYIHMHKTNDSGNELHLSTSQQLFSYGLNEMTTKNYCPRQIYSQVAEPKYRPIGLNKKMPPSQDMLTHASFFVWALSAILELSITWRFCNEQKTQTWGGGRLPNRKEKIKLDDSEEEESDSRTNESELSSSSEAYVNWVLPLEMICSFLLLTFVLSLLYLLHAPQFPLPSAHSGIQW